VIEKSGVEEDQGYEPPPSPPPRRFGFWPWSRSSSTNYRYLTKSVIEAIRRAPVKRHRWQFIVVHNSGTRQGNAAFSIIIIGTSGACRMALLITSSLVTNIDW